MNFKKTALRDLKKARLRSLSAGLSVHNSAKPLSDMVP